MIMHEVQVIQVSHSNSFANSYMRGNIVYVVKFIVACHIIVFLCTNICTNYSFTNNNADKSLVLITLQ